MSIDLRKVSSRRFGAGIGGGALLDPDTLEPLASGASITLAASGAPIGVSMAANLGGTDGDGIPFYIADAAAPAPTLSRIAITVADPSAQLGGEFMATLTYGLGGPTVSFWVDVRHRGCILKTWGGSDVDLNAVYPDQTACAAAMAADPHLVTSVDVAAGTSAETADYTSLSGAVNSKAEALLAAGTSIVDAITAASAERAAARGVYKVVVLPASFSTADGTIAFSALPMDATARSLVPRPSGLGETVDHDVSIRLGPSCQVFGKPVRVCIHVGDTALGAFSRNLRFSSQSDCADASKGYGAMEPAAAQTFNPISGELCGFTSHFSLALVVLAPVALSPTVPKIANMGGSCPSDCSGKGYCRAEGRCTCFVGFTGYDCSQRSCAIAQSWDTGANVVHKQVECANRGICDRISGLCAW